MAQRPAALTEPREPTGPGPIRRMTPVRAGLVASAAVVVAVGARAREAETRRATTPTMSRRLRRREVPMRRPRRAMPPLTSLLSPPPAPCPDRAVGGVVPVPAQTVATCVMR